jgi:putative oxidoreductase
MTPPRFALAPRAGSALLILRVVLGSTMFAHGYQKVFTYGFAGVAGSFAQMGVPLPGVMGPFIALLELLGGIALIIGLLTRLAALGIAFDMLGAMALVHFKNGFFLPTGFEFVFVLMGMAVTIALAGAGNLSADQAIAGRRAAATPLAAR